MIEKRLPLTIITLCLLYLTISLACDPAAYRLIHIYGFEVAGSSFIYASLYTILDMLTRMTGRQNVIKLIFIFHLFDLIFSYTLYFISQLPMPEDFQYTQLNLILEQFPRLFWSGIFGALIAGIVEISIYSFLQRKIKNFMVASLISTLIIMLAHNVPTDYFAFKPLYPERVKSIVAMNFAISACLLVVSTAIGQISLIFIDKYHRLHPPDIEK